MTEENSFIFNQLLVSGKWALQSNTNYVRLILLRSSKTAQHNNYYVEFHSFLWWKWQTISNPLAVLLNKEEKRCLKNFAVEEAKACIMRNSI